MPSSWLWSKFISGEAENRSQKKESLDFLAKISKISVESQPIKSSGMKFLNQKKREESELKRQVTNKVISIHEEIGGYLDFHKKWQIPRP
jgi:hypothetical protein